MAIIMTHLHYILKSPRIVIVQVLYYKSVYIIMTVYTEGTMRSALTYFSFMAFNLVLTERATTTTAICVFL